MPFVQLAYIQHETWNSEESHLIQILGGFITDSKQTISYKWKQPTILSELNSYL